MHEAMSKRTRRRVYCEMIAHAEIAAPNVLDALASRRIDPIVAVQPGPRDELVRLCRRAEERGLSVTIWPMLADEDGRWASLDNADRFAAFVRSLVDALDAEGVCPTELLLDLEPPIDRVKRMLHLRPKLTHAKHPQSSAAILVALVRDLETRATTSIRTSAAVIPLVLFDDERGGFERVLGTPVSSIAWNHASVMVYTTLLEGYTRGLLERRDVLSLLASTCRLASTRFGDRAGISLGAVGKGALGDEATYRSPRELHEDVSIARAAGIDDLTLFDLGGAVHRPPLEAWLDAFVHAEPAAVLPEETPKSRVALTLCSATSRIAAALASRA